MGNQVKIFEDGEKIPNRKILSIYTPPPQVPEVFNRNTLIVGTRGAGKSTIIRYQKALHSGMALHISLITELACLTKQTGVGPLSRGFSPLLENLIIKKASSLLTISIAERIIAKGGSIAKDLILDFLPHNLKHGKIVLNAKWFNEIKNDLSRCPIESFGELPESITLKHFISTIGELLNSSGEPLLLLLDRADMVPGPALIPVMELLDQESE